ncbi:GNAT family N-acetyltransferase [Micromonospora sp. U21]|nr:GNAT family N-acetyltransferase [Micromonospora sp. U21]
MAGRAPKACRRGDAGVEIGWRLDRRSWGFGYATEAATAAMRFGFLDRGLDRIISVRHVENVRSTTAVRNRTPAQS